ncbi:MAG: hypothetical protein ACOYNM_07125, partial [Gemmataceae bacterium]
LIPVLNEEDATIMSEADNIYANKLNSVVVVTAGPGILNSVNAILIPSIQAPKTALGNVTVSNFGTPLKNNANLLESCARPSW